MISRAMGHVRESFNKGMSFPTEECEGAWNGRRLYESVYVIEHVGTPVLISEQLIDVLCVFVTHSFYFCILHDQEQNFIKLIIWGWVGK